MYDVFGFVRSFKGGCHLMDQPFYYTFCKSLGNRTTTFHRFCHQSRTQFMIIIHNTVLIKIFKNISARCFMCFFYNQVKHVDSYFNLLPKLHAGSHDFSSLAWSLKMLTAVPYILMTDVSCHWLSSAVFLQYGANPWLSLSRPQSCTISVPWQNVW